MNPTEKATQLLAAGYSCSQSLLVSRATQFGLSDEIALKLSAAFGGGLGREGEVCGAASGALMVIGLANGQTSPEQREAKERTYQLTRRFLAEFARRTGALHCSDLLGCQIGTPEGMQRAQSQDLFKTVCPTLVSEASQILSELLDEKEQEK